MHYRLPLTGVGNQLIYGDYGGQVSLLDATTGEILWQRKVGKTRDTYINSIVVSNGVVFAATSATTEIEAIDLQTGKLFWYVQGSQHDIPSRGADLFLWKNDLYVFTAEVHILDAKTGVIKREISENLTPSQLQGDKFYADRWVREVGTLILISELVSPSYKLLWDNCKSFMTPYRFSDDLFYAVGECGGVYALDIETNQIKWQYREDVAGETPTAIYRNTLYVLFDDGEIHGIDSETGQQRGVLKTGLRIPGVVQNASFLSRGVVANEEVIVVTFNDKNVWAFCEDPCF